MTIKEEYEAVLKSGMFWVWFPKLSGNWHEDMPDFIEYSVIKYNRKLEIDKIIAPKKK